MNMISNAFGLLAAAGVGSAAGGAVMGALYCVVGASTLVAMSLLMVWPGLVLGVVGWAGVRWGIRRDQRRFLSRLEARRDLVRGMPL